MTDATADLTTTQKLWKPISTLEAEQEQVGKELRAAAQAGDLIAAKAAVERMEEIQRQMSRAGRAVREHVRTKALAAEQSYKSKPDKSNYPGIQQMLLHAWEWALQTGRVPGVSTETEESNEQA